MFDYKNFFKYTLLSLSLVNLNQIYCMEEKEFHQVAEQAIKGFQITIDNNTGYDLLIKSEYFNLGEYRTSSEAFISEIILHPEAKLIVDYKKEIAGHTADIKKIEVDYKNTLISHKIEINSDQILSASNAGKSDIEISLGKQLITGAITYSFKEKKPLDFIDIESIDILNQSDKPIIIRKKIVNINDNIETKSEEFIPIQPREERNVIISPQHHPDFANKSLTTGISVAFGTGLIEYLDLPKYRNNINLFIKEHVNVIKEIQWIKFLDKDLVKKLKSFTEKPEQSPTLKVIAKSHGLLFPTQKIPAIQLWYRNKETKQLELSDYKVTQKIIK